MSDLPVLGGAPLGFVGLGTMGGAIARNLAQAGFPLLVYDTDQAKSAELHAGAGSAIVRVADNLQHLARECRVVCLSLPHPPVFVAVARQLLETLSPGFVIVDFGTALPSQAREIAAVCSDCGGALLEAPVSGGAGGARQAALRIFAAGEVTTFESVKPLLESAGDPDRVVYCGPSGRGQAVKAANQLMMGLVNAALLESASVGLQLGVEPEVLDRALGGSGGARALLSGVLERIRTGTGEEIGVKSLQLVDYAREAEATGLQLPMTSALADFLGDAELCVQEANRFSPSFLRELLRNSR